MPLVLSRHAVCSEMKWLQKIDFHSKYAIWSRRFHLRNVCRCFMVWYFEMGGLLLEKCEVITISHFFSINWITAHEPKVKQLIWLPYNWCFQFTSFIFSVVPSSSRLDYRSMRQISDKPVFNIVLLLRNLLFRSFGFARKYPHQILIWVSK